MANIRPNDLPNDNAPSVSDVVIIDGLTTRKTTLDKAVNAGRPNASQAEAEAGLDATKSMTPLTTRQATIAYGVNFAPAAKGVPTGGLTSQVLAKNSATDNDVVWTNAGAGDMLSNQNLSSLTSFPDGRKNMAVPTYVATRTAMKALNPTKDPLAFLQEGERKGVFYWSSSNLSALVTADTAEAMVIAPTSDPTGASGAFVRDSAFVDPKFGGAIYGGVTDTRAALAAVDSIAVAMGKSLMVTGSMKISSAITIAANQFFTPGGKLVPDNNIVVILSGRPDAGAWQIFDRSNGGGVHFDKGAGEVWVEWWGARPEPSGRTDNQIPIQYAIDACGSVISAPSNMGPAPNANGNGGIVRFASSNSYKVSGRIQLRNRTIVRGNGGYAPELLLNNATWNGDTEMVLSQNGTQSQFWCRLEDMVINANGLSTMNRVVYAPAWQESCGMRDVLIRNFYNTGLLVDSFYGGSVGIALKGVQFFPWATPGNFVRALEVSSPASIARQHIILDEVSFAGITSAAPPGINAIGIKATGRVEIDCRGTFVEGYDIGVALFGGSSLFGNFTGPGNPSVSDLIQTDGAWTGIIDAIVTKGSAVNLLNSFTGGLNRIYRDVEPLGRRIIYPHTPMQVLASGTVTGGAGTPSLSVSQAITAVSKTSTGIYRLTFDTTIFKPSSANQYRIRIANQSIVGSTWYNNGGTTTYVEVAFRNLAGTLADVTDFDFEIYARPGT